MTGEVAFVIVVLGATVLLFMSGRMRLDLVALLALLALAVSRILTPAEALAGFSDQAVIMIAALFVVGAAMMESGLAERFGGALGRFAGSSRARLTAVLMLGTGLLSSFMSTTGTVALMIPVTAALARNAGMSPSLLLMPMSTAALLGGLLTLIATPPNIIVSERLADAGLQPFALFDFTPIGIAALLIGMAVMVPLGGRLLRPRAPVNSPAGAGGAAIVPGEELISGYDVGLIARMRVRPDSPLVGVTPAAAELRKRYDTNVVSLRRGNSRGSRMSRVQRTAEEPLQAGDQLEVRGSAENLEKLAAEQRLEFQGYRSTPDAVLAEVLLTPRSRLIGRTLAEVKFRNRYSVNVLSIRRQGQTLQEHLANVPLRFADTLLVAGSPGKIEMLKRDAGDFVVVSRTREMAPRGRMSREEVATLVVIAGMVLMLAFSVMPAVLVVLVAAVSLVLSGTVSMEGAYRSVNWQSVVLIAAMLPVATALQKTGGLDVVVRQLDPLVGMGPYLTMFGLFLVTAALGMFVSNTATAVLLAPVALALADQLGTSPYPLMMTVAVAASTSFATPMATPANMLVMGPGEYEFRDYVKVGLVVQGLVLVLAMLLVPVLFPFR